MHPDLSPHLHTQECNELIAVLKKCHADNPYKRFIGACTEADIAMTKCLKAEREQKRQANMKRSQEAKKRESVIAS